jgi:hypothetical protein
MYELGYILGDFATNIFVVPLVLRLVSPYIRHSGLKFCTRALVSHPRAKLRIWVRIFVFG